jgi:protein-disulfide isomerase
MNIKRILFWVGFVVVLSLIIWGLIVAMHKGPATGGSAEGVPMPLTAVDHVRGPENAPVTVIEYADYQCPACASYHPVVERLIMEASTTVRFVMRHFPLAQHRNAVAAAQAAEAAGKQNKYWDMAALLFDNQKSWETLTATQAREVFKGYAERLALNIAAYETDFASADIKSKIDADRADGIAIGVNSTPTFFVNGKSIVNPAGYEAFKKVIDTAATGDSN